MQGTIAWSLSGLFGRSKPSFHHRVFDKEAQRDWNQLAAALHLTTMWEFEEVRKRLIEDMSQLISSNAVEPLDRVEVSIQCRVNQWLHPAYQQLCERTTALTTKEAKGLGIDRLAAIYRVRDALHASKTSPGGSCHRCGRTTQAYFNQAPAVSALSLIQGEPILSSVEGPLVPIGET